MERKGKHGVTRLADLVKTLKHSEYQCYPPYSDIKRLTQLNDAKRGHIAFKTRNNVILKRRTLKAHKSGRVPIL